LKNVIRWIVQNPSNQGQIGRRILAVIGWQVWKRAIGFPIVIPLNNGCRLLAYPDCQVASNAIYNRVPEFPEVDFLHRVLRGGIMIDVGSNIGLFTLLIGDCMDQFILFEPNPVAARRAAENFSLNELHFEVHQMAVSDRTGKIFLEDRGGTDSTNMTRIHPNGSRFPLREVDCVSLDDFFQRRNERLSFIKIDVEGHECSVFRGMKRILQKRRPDVVMFEYLQRTNIREIQALLAAVGYKIFRLTHDADPVPVDGSPRPMQDLFAFPREALP